MLQYADEKKKYMVYVIGISNDCLKTFSPFIFPSPPRCFHRYIMYIERVHRASGTRCSRTCILILLFDILTVIRNVFVFAGLN